jgi:hypothetical protein
MKLKYCQISFRAFNHKRRRIRKKYFHILMKIDKKEKFYENISVWEDFLVFEREKGL